MLVNKKILIISPQRWGKMHLIKHRYAIELAHRGNEVCFLNPPDISLNKDIQIEHSNEFDNLNIVTYRPFFPFAIRFRFRWLYDFLIGFQIKKVIKSIDKEFDIVWCFDLLLYSDLKKFGGKLTIFHIGDVLHYAHQTRIAHSADIIFEVVPDVFNILEDVNVPVHFINHGISTHFEKYAIKTLADLDEEPETTATKPIKIGYTGNILRPDIDQACFKKIIEGNLEVQFHIWGPTTISNNNINSGDSLKVDQLKFVDFLNSQANIHLRGVKSPEVLAEEMQEMQGFIICYDIDKDQSKGTNYHKVMEYLSTGMVLISNNVTTYKDRDDLVQMPEERNNSELPTLAKTVFGNLEHHNNPRLQRKRLEFALDNSYPKQLDRINKILQNHVAKSGT